MIIFRKTFTFEEKRGNLFWTIFLKRLPFAVFYRKKETLHMVEKVYPMTLEGKEKLEKELEELKTVKRGEIIERIKIADRKSVV